MGVNYFDAYSPSHFFAGVTFYLIGIDFITGIILHTIYEIFTNYFLVKKGGYCIKIPFLKIADCKTKPDSIKNIIGDTISFALGFIIAQFIIKEPKFKNINIYIKLIIILFIIPIGYSTLTTNILGYLPDYEHYSKNKNHYHRM